MKYDFTSIPERPDALAYAGLGQIRGFAPDAPEAGFDAIPMWVADMNFAVYPEIQRAISARVSQPTFGYFPFSADYLRPISWWQENRNGVAGLGQEHIGYENGVLGGVATALRVLGNTRGGSVLVHTPVYVGFMRLLTDAGYQVAESPLVRDRDGVWRMDLADMEEKIKKHHIHTAICCSPHNPTGRVWEKEELAAMMALYARLDVNVIADEIWSDLVFSGHRHIPVQTVSEDAAQRTIAFYAPSKTFNLAGLVGSYHVVYNRRLADLMNREAALTRYNNPNILTLHAMMAAYSEGGAEWTDELLQVLEANSILARERLLKMAPQLQIGVPEGTYMLFADCGEYLRQRSISIDQLLHASWRVGVAVQDGRQFGWPDSVRMNLAMPRRRLEEAMDRLEKYVFTEK